MLLYHRIADGASATPQARFREHMAWLEANCDIVSLDDVLSLAGRPVLDRPAVAITFDDGYLDNYTHAFPLLAERSIPATFFLTTGFIDRHKPVVDRLRRLTESSAEPMTWSQAAEMAASGMKIGAHTVSHPNLATSREDLAQREIIESKRAIEERLGIKVDAFAYPFGKPKHHVVPSTTELVRQAGFEKAVTVCFRGITPNQSAYRIPRFAIGADSVAELAGVITGKMDLLGRWQELAPRSISHLLSPTNSHRRENSLLGSTVS